MGVFGTWKAHYPPNPPPKHKTNKCFNTDVMLLLLLSAGGGRALELLHNILLALTSLAMLVGIIRACVTSGKTASLHDMLCSPFDETDPVFVVTSRTFF